MQFDRPIVITTGASRKATIWKPETLLWSELCRRLGSFHRSTETLAQYKEMPKSKQDKQKTAYEMSLCDWSSDVCSSDLLIGRMDKISVGGESLAI